ncbi:MAG: hypothetical protein J1F32_02455 [Erysipelotrichales bacterium]|nr:hypothetical protein [Erysipelotrichales bacterium]
MNYILFNPKANSDTGEKSVPVVKEKLKARFGEIVSVNLIDINVADFIRTCSKEDNVILLGGDGTLNKFANAIQNIEMQCNLYLFKAGTGNDFLNDIENNIDSDGLALINEYVKHLPYVIVNDQKHYFINGVGLGIDGQVCKIVEEKKKAGAKKVSYAGVCIKIALFKYKFPNATIIVDGVTVMRKRVWLTAAMNGRYFGGGLMIAPNQDRKNNELTMACVHSATRLFVLMVFMSVFKGKHVKYKKVVNMVKGRKIEVMFDRPTTLQIDGEVIDNVTHYIAIKE